MRTVSLSDGVSAILCSLLLAAGCTAFPMGSLAAATTTTPEEEAVTRVYEAVKSGRISSPEAFRAALAKLPPAKITGTAAPTKDANSKAPSSPPAHGPDDKAAPVLAPSPRPAIEKEAITEFEDYVGIRKSFLSKDDEAEPAKISWTKDLGAPSFYTLDLAVRLRGQEASNGKKAKGFSFLNQHSEIGGQTVAWTIEPTFEAHISSEEKKAQDSLSARLPVTLSWRPDLKQDIPASATDEEADQAVAEHAGQHLITQWFLTISPVYEFDRLMNNETIGGDFFLTANVPKAYIGSYYWITKRPTVANTLDGGLNFHWRPYLGFEGGHVLEAQQGTEIGEESEFARFAAKVHAEVSYVRRRPQMEKDQLNFPRQFVLSIDYYFRQDIEGQQAAHSYVEVSPLYYFDIPEHFSIGLTYKRGTTTPKFAQVDSLNVWLGIKF